MKNAMTAQRPSKIMRVIDRLCTAPTNYAVLTYKEQLFILFWRVMHRQNSLGNGIMLLWMLLQFALSFILTPVAFILHLCGYRFLSVDLTQIGSVIWLELYMRDNLTGAKRPKNKIIVARSRITDGNAFAFNLYGSYYTFVYSPLLRVLLYPFFINIFFQERVAPYEHTFTMRKNLDPDEPCIAQGVYQKYQKQFGKPLCQLTDEQVALGKKQLSTLMNFDRPFITLHVRDSHFYNEKHFSLRNSNVHDYELAIKWLISEGYIVVRAGTSTAAPIDDMLSRCGPNLVDYAKSSIQSDFLDCFLASECEFYLGVSSGFTFLPPIFETPSCYTNFYNPMQSLGFCKGDLTSFKKFRWIKDDTLVPFHDILREPYNRNLSLAALTDMGIKVVDNTPEEILETVQEFLNFDPENLSDIQKMAKQEMPVWNYCYNADGNFSNTILKEYHLDKIKTPQIS